MGDITGRPKAPAQQVVYVPQFTTAPSSTTTTTSESSSGATSSDSKTLTPSQQREQSLLSQSRSRIGTILTGFRGILSQSDKASSSSQRKTLLGE